MRVTEILSKAEIKTLVAASDARGFAAVLTSWSLIAGSLALVAWRPAWWSVALALVILGGRHLALGILMHEAAHHSLFRTRALNDALGGWLCAAPAWQDLRRYRTHHLAHHKLVGTPEDPDLSLTTGYPTTRRSLARKFARDLFGITGVKRVFGLVLMDLGFIEYTASAKVVRIDQRGRPLADVLRVGARNLSPVLLANVVLFAIMGWKLYLLWVIAYFTTYSVFLRVRSISEHACADMVADTFANTRTTLASPLARLTVAPHRVNFHLEHHLLMTVPYFRLPALHRLLRERGALRCARVAQNYREVLRFATAR